MERKLRAEAEEIVRVAIQTCLPDEAVQRALTGRQFERPVTLVAIGKAAWRMANAAYAQLGEAGVARGVVLTKYGHLGGAIGNLELLEAGHPIPDNATVRGTARILELVSGLTAADTVLFLVSGGGSALFEKPLIPLEELADINRQLLACGASIGEMNTVRKHLSAVKGGRFAALCAPAQVYAVVLSDVVGDRLDVIASGPACPDTSTAAEAAAVVRQYGLQLSAQACGFLQKETPKTLSNVKTVVTGSVSELCRAAGEKAAALGYRPLVLTDCLGCQAKEAGSFLASMARYFRQTCTESTALIVGGETVVELNGKGLGGRSQELALAAAAGIEGLAGVAVIAAGSDGTDGPTDAAGGVVDGETAAFFRRTGSSIDEILRQNNAYPALDAADALLRIGPTGTNVNDVAVALIRPNL